MSIWPRMGVILVPMIDVPHVALQSHGSCWVWSSWMLCLLGVATY